MGDVGLTGDGGPDVVVLACRRKFGVIGRGCDPNPALRSSVTLVGPGGATVGRGVDVATVVRRRKSLATEDAMGLQERDPAAV